ncbi:MAG: STAS domain-containing protein [Burkholderiales bacterium]|nr:STAS domain-containing protein [Burkholderiales bacterium]
MQLPATATLPETGALVQGVERSLAATAPGAAFDIDASALTAFDTSVLALLLQARRLAQAAGRGFAVRGAPAKLVQLARLYGVDALLEFAPDAAT